MSRRRIATSHTPDRGNGFVVVDPRAFTVEQAYDLLYLAFQLRRWHRILDACDGDVDAARRIMGEVDRVTGPVPL